MKGLIGRINFLEAIIADMLVIDDVEFIHGEEFLAYRTFS